MIDLDEGLIVRADQKEKIKKWAVVFLTPKGIVDDLETALEVVKSMDLPSEVIKPAVMAKGSVLEELCV